MKQLIVALLLMIVVTTTSIRYATAQSMPMLPPPFPETRAQEEEMAENDQTPPIIEILTTELYEGKNVFKVRLTDESSLRTREVKYVHDGELRVDGLFRDQNNVYKALIDIKPPSRVVVVTAEDINGNIASAFREYEISKSQNILGQIGNRLSEIFVYFQNVFGR